LHFAGFAVDCDLSWTLPATSQNLFFERGGLESNVRARYVSIAKNIARANFWFLGVSTCTLFTESAGAKKARPVA